LHTLGNYEGMSQELLTLSQELLHCKAQHMHSHHKQGRTATNTGVEHLQGSVELQQVYCDSSPIAVFCIEALKCIMVP
jgi:hypothetical protein